MLLLLQACTLPAWVGPTMAISLVVIALAFVVIAAAIGMAIARVLGEIKKLHEAVESLRGDLHPAVTAVRSISDEGRRLAALVGGEAGEELLAASKASGPASPNGCRTSRPSTRCCRRRWRTAIDLAITLRGFRRGAGWYGRIRRLLGAGRR